MALLSVVVVCSSFIGTTAHVAVSGTIDKSRDQPIDLLVTAGASPVTALGGQSYLAPDAWMTPGLITSDQIRAVARVPGVDVVAPVTVLPTMSKPVGEMASAWVPLAPGSDAAWTAVFSASTVDGTGTRRTDPTKVTVVIQGSSALTGPDVQYVSRWGDDGAPAVLLTDGSYRESSATKGGVGAATVLTSSARSFSVAVDPEAEAQLARAAGEDDLARAMDSLGTRSSAEDAGTLEQAMAEMATPLTPGEPTPALVSAEDRGDMVVDATMTLRTPEAVDPSLVEGSLSSCSATRLLTACSRLTSGGIAAVESLPTQLETSSSLRSPILPWGLSAHPYTTANSGEVVAVTIGPYWAEAGAGSASVLAPLQREDATGTGANGAPSATVVPVGASISLGGAWHDEVYRPNVIRSTPVPALSLLAGADQTYSPVDSFLPGTSPLSASTIRTASGPVLQTLDGTGGATSAAPALVSRQFVGSLMGEADLGANVLRVRLERPDGQVPSDPEIERVVAQIADEGLDATVLIGASKTDVAVNLTGQDPLAWHGTATETWTELGANVRVERATGFTLRFLPLLAVFAVGALIVVVERGRRSEHRSDARVLLAAGWSGTQVRRRFVSEHVLGMLLVSGGSALAVYLGARRVVVGSLALTGPLAGVAVAACVSAAGLSWWDGWRAGALDRLEAPPPAHVHRRQLRGFVPALRALRRALRVRRTTVPPQWLSREPGRWPVSAAAVASGVAAAAARQVLTVAADDAGRSAVAVEAWSAVGAAARALLLLTVFAAALLLVAGIQADRRASERRQHLLCVYGWSRPSRWCTEVVIWLRQYGLGLLAALAAVLTGVLVPGTSSLVLGGGVAVAVLLSVLAAVIVVATRAPRLQTIDLPSARPARRVR